MIQSNKMIYQPPKYHHHHSNSFTHFLQLHSSPSSSINSSNNNSISHSNRMLHGEDSQSDERTKLEIHDQSSNTSNATTEIDVANESTGKSFTIAAILGLKKNSVHPLSHQSCEMDENASSMHDEYNADFPIINLTTHSKIFQKFENDNRHGYMLQAQSAEHSSQMPPVPIEQCVYDNNTTSNSSYQEHLHKQHIHNSEFNVNYNRNVDELSLSTQANPVVLRNHIHPSGANILSKAFNRDRSRVDHFTSKNKAAASISLKNKRVRTIFTPEQLERLEAEFERQQYMVGPERLYLAHTLQLTEAQVKVWFQNRRIKSRKQHFEMTQHHLAIARQRQQHQQQPTMTPLPSKEESSINSDEQVVSDVDD